MLNFIDVISWLNLLRKKTLAAGMARALVTSGNLVKKSLVKRGVTIRPATASDMDGIATILHEVFAEEVGQYDQNVEGRIVDRLHGRNIYVVAVCDDRVVGLVAGSIGSPFSIEAKLGEHIGAMDAIKDLCIGEVRLLSVKKDFRSSGMYLLLVAELIRILVESSENRHRFVVISAYKHMAASYAKLGARQFAPEVKYSGKSFIPMVAERGCAIYEYARILALQRYQKIWEA